MSVLWNHQRPWFINSLVSQILQTPLSTFHRQDFEVYYNHIWEICSLQVKSPFPCSLLAESELGQFQPSVSSAHTEDLESNAGWVLLGWASDVHKSCFNIHPFSHPSISRQSFIKQRKVSGFTANILTYLLNNNQGNFCYIRIVWDCLVCLWVLVEIHWNILIYVMMPAGGTKLLKKSLYEQLSWMTNQV